MKSVFLDRDGVINRERGDYTYIPEDFELIAGVADSISKIKSAGFNVIVITNQAGIAKGRYSIEQMKSCHLKMQQACHNQIDEIYFAPLHPTISESLARKPGSLMFERAIAKFKVDPAKSWMVGDKMRDLVPAKALGLNTVLVGDVEMGKAADHHRDSLYDCLDLIC